MCNPYQSKVLYLETNYQLTHGLTTNGLSTIFLSLIMMIVTATWLYAY